MDRTGTFWSLYRRYRAWSAPRGAKSARRLTLLIGAGVGTLLFFLISQNFGPRATIAMVGWGTVVLCPVAGLDAWCGTKLSGRPAVAWARAAFWCAFSLFGLYLALNAGTVVGFLER